MPKVELFETKDGSHSLLLPEMNETYHSTHGAKTESVYVFIDKGLHHYRSINPKQETVRILEVGFGTGLNPWLTALEADKGSIKVEFTSLEKFPLEPEIISKLNYADAHDEVSKSIFDKIHEVKWETLQPVSDYFSVNKLNKDIHTFHDDVGSYDIIYFDAFAPSKQPEMWTPEILGKMYDLLSDRGVFTTYCAQGQFKRDLKSVGFTIEELQGPPGKKEMTRGIKQ